MINLQDKEYSFTLTWKNISITIAITIFVMGGILYILVPRDYLKQIKTLEVEKVQINKEKDLEKLEYETAIRVLDTKLQKVEQEQEKVKEQVKKKYNIQLTNQ